MPLYEYRCSACGKTFEELVLAGDAPAGPRCSQCGSAAVARLLSTFAAHATSSSSSPFEGCGDGACGSGACEAPGACGMGGGCGGFDLN